MADREKVIRGLVRFIDDFKPFCGNRADWQKVYDALALLREQDEGIEPEISRKSVTETTVSLRYKCGACGGEIEQGDDKFCRHCGKKVKWDD